MTITRTRHDDVEIAYETFGPPSGDPLLLIMGTGAQMLFWPDDFCEALVDRGFAVARFDNRDAGLSTHLSVAGVPNQLMLTVVGQSMGGMIAQTMAIRHPSRVLSLTSISSRSAPAIGRAHFRTVLRLLVANSTVVTRRPPSSPDQAAEQLVRAFRIIGSPGHPLDEAWLREVGRRMFERGLDPAGGQRHNAAILASGDRTAALGGVRVPALVLHGAADPMLRPEGGQATAAAIPGARLVTLPGMGHDLPRALWPLIVDEIRAVADRGCAHGNGVAHG